MNEGKNTLSCEQKTEDPCTYQYNMDHKNIGKCIIINNENVQGTFKRHGTDEDARKLEATFGALGFKVEVAKDLTANKMYELLETVAKEDHRELACFACVLLSHGREGHISGTDTEIKIRLLASLFTGERCQSLFGKPKLFFIQACRGKEYDSGIETDSAIQETTEIHETPEADFLCVHSTASGYYSWRNQVSGSVFIGTLCEMLNKHYKELELMKILTRVNHSVAMHFQSATPDDHSNAKKQMPCIMSRLTKELYFVK
ncbi:caspase-7-like [Acipenser ruthenus]|uniref:caspase-7-like n=1 Tax=Acipenser ruthenus TaxID=7906 RepID=UPI0027408508|nr:caspase-7-like [Acipenser ruthenus]